MGVLEDRALDERSALTLDPVEVVTVGPAAAARASASAFFTKMRTRSRWCSSTHSVFR